MKILILTPINPVMAQEVYDILSREFHNYKELNLICFPFFAAMRSSLENVDYVPALFAILKASLIPDVHKKLYNKKINIVIGNVFKEEKFDMVVSYKRDEEEVFDSYIEAINTFEEFKEFQITANVDELYTPEDAEINIPTKEHLKLFMKGVLDTNDKSKSKTKKSS